VRRRHARTDPCLTEEQAPHDALTARFQHIPVRPRHQIRGSIGYREGWPLDAERIECPVRIVWGTADRILPWPRAAARFRDDSLPHADWVELGGVAHLPQLDVPLETAQLILGFTSESSP
jgi:pimeloyl-ACP methyl ester carboxylesterase